MTQAACIAVLNGPSSSGKTTLARLARDVLGPHAVALSIDDFYAGLHHGRRNDWSLFLSLTRVLFETAASFGREGFDVIVDTVFERPECRDVCQAALRQFRVVLVRVDCPVDVLTERERMRSDRRPGLAADQARRVHEGYTYNLALDTAAMPPSDCARAIADAVAATTFDGE
jgi:chloramphenicol 3-O phosphotransferase